MRGGVRKEGFEGRAAVLGRRETDCSRSATPRLLGEERAGESYKDNSTWLGGKGKREMLGAADGRGGVCPVPAHSAPGRPPPCLPQQRGMSPVGLAGQEQPAQARGHGWSPPLFPGRGVALAGPWLGFLRHKMEAAPSRGPSGAPVMLRTGSIRPETTLVRSGII